MLIIFGFVESGLALKMESIYGSYIDYVITLGGPEICDIVILWAYTYPPNVIMQSFGPTPQCNIVIV